jgi:hypothetical protein
MLQQPEREGFAAFILFLHQLEEDHSEELTNPEISDISTIEMYVVHLRKLFNSD